MIQDESESHLSASEESIDDVSCWFLACEFGNVGVFSLIDSGSSVNICSRRVYDKIPQKCKTPIISTQHKLTSASGSPLQLVGQCSLTMLIEEIEFVVEMQIASSLGSLQIFLGYHI